MGQNGFLTKTYGGVDPKSKYPLSDKDAQNWPALEKEVASHATSQMPDAVRKTRRIRPMNFWERFTTPSDTEAITTPFNSIALNRKAIEANGTDLGNVLTHELTHVNQLNNKGILGRLFGGLNRLTTSYDDNPDEIAAYAAEGNRKIPSRKDIKLPEPTGESYNRPGPRTYHGLLNRSAGFPIKPPTRRDIHLPVEKKK